MTPYSNKYLMGLGHLPLPEKERAKLFQTYTSYALSCFAEISVGSSKNYVVTSAKVVESRDGEILDPLTGRASMAGPVAQFELKWVNTYAPSREEPEAAVSLPKIVRFGWSASNGENDSEREIVCCCTCNQMQSMGFPCRHIIRVATVYPEQITWNASLTTVLGTFVPISQLFDRYWRRETKDLTPTYVSDMRMTAGVYKGEAVGSKLFRANGEEASMLGVEDEVRKYLSWIEISNLGENMCRDASNLGLAALQSLRHYLDHVQDLLCQNKLPSVPAANNLQSSASGTEDQALPSAVADSSVEVSPSLPSHAAGHIYPPRRNDVLQEPLNKRARTGSEHMKE
ncbi:unnamed protein product [Agarophyton chilense]